LDILKITKQSLARVLKQLIGKGFIMQRHGNDDRRERRLFVTAKGGRLADKLTALQIKRIEAALAKAGPGARELTRRFLFAMIAESDRPRVEALIKLHPGTTAGG
jgi:DNA-binding MarR family transcriptional regulator